MHINFSDKKKKKKRKVKHIFPFEERNANIEKRLKEGWKSVICRIASFFSAEARRKLLADKEEIYVDVAIKKNKKEKKRKEKGARRVLLTIYDEYVVHVKNLRRTCVPAFHVYNYFPT